MSAICHEQSCDTVWTTIAFSSSSLFHTFLSWGLTLCSTELIPLEICGQTEALGEQLSLLIVCL